MKKLSLACFFFLQFIYHSNAQLKKIGNGNPEQSGFSTAKLNRIDTVLQQYIDSGFMPGAAALVIKDNKIIYYKEHGFADGERKRLVKKDDIFRIASQTKAITSVAVMMLFEEGRFLLDDPIQRYIPEFRDAKVLDRFNDADTSYTTVAAKRPVTIRDLLTHTSGIGYAQIGSPAANAIYAKNNITAGIGTSGSVAGDAMKRLARLPLMHQPGEQWTYGLNTDVLGYFVELISGMTLDNFFRTRIFEPLGMTDTYFYLPEQKKSRLTPLMTFDSTGKLASGSDFRIQNSSMDPDYPKLKGTYFSGGAGLSSTLMDYAIFLQMLLNEGEYNGKRILSRHSVRMMTTNQIGQLNLGLHKFGLGFQLVTKESSGLMPMQEGSFSWGGAFATSYWVDPKEKLVAVFFKQLLGDQHGELANKFRVLVYSAMK